MDIYARLDELSTKLMQIAICHATDKVEADDIYQEIVEKTATTCKVSDTDSYICQLATWTARNLVNSERIYARYVTVNPESEDSEETYDFAEIIADNSISVEDQLIQSEIYAEVNAKILEIMDQLDETNQQIVVLLKKGNTQQNIADKLDMTRTAVSNRIHRMRGIFKAYGLSPSYLAI